MSLKTPAELTLEIDAAVNPAGGPPLITGAGLNTVLHSLATELTTLPTEVAAAGAGQLAELRAALQGQVLVQSAATGTRTYCTSWEQAHAAAAPGDVVTFGPGTFGDPSRQALIQKDLEVRLHAATTWQFSMLYLHTAYQATRRRVRLVGEGCLKGTIMWYGDTPLDVELRHVRHEGVLVHNAYLTTDSNLDQLLLDGVRFAAPAGADYLTAFTRYGGYYFKPLAVTVRNCQGTVPGGAFYRNTGSGGNPSDAAGNLLRIQGSHLECAPGQPLVVAPDGVVTYDFAQVSYSGTLPDNVLAATQYQFLGLPASAPSSPNADVLRASRVRTAYPSAAAALAAATAPDVVSVYTPLPLAETDLGSEILNVPAGVSLTLLTDVSRPNQRTDILTLRGGSGVINGQHHALRETTPGNYTNWFIGNYPNVAVDYAIHDLHLDVHNTVGLQVSAQGTIRYSGDITAAGGDNSVSPSALPATVVVDTNYSRSGAAPATLLGRGTFRQAGGLLAIVNGQNCYFEWSGDVTASADARFELRQGTLCLKNGLLHGGTRSAGAEKLVAKNGSDTHLILENYTVLGTPGQPAIEADTVTLRGSTVVVGTIVATTIIDERPTASAPAPSAAPAPGLEVVASANVSRDVPADYVTSLTNCEPTLDVRPAGLPGGWNIKTGEYVAPLSGIYELQVRLHLMDGDAPAGAVYSIAAGPSNKEGSWVLWFPFSPGDTPNRQGAQATRVLYLSAGQAVHASTTLGGFATTVYGELTVKLLCRSDGQQVAGGTGGTR
jgi:hypothetical protein